MKKELLVDKDPKSPISEIFRSLRTNIQFMNSGKTLKTLLVTSTIQGEGKSLIVANLAITFAQMEKKVIIVDADMRKGRQHDIFGIVSRPGLSNYLSGIEEEGYGNEKLEEYIKKTDIENLSIMPAGDIPPNPAELILSEKMQELLVILKEKYDIVIFDGTPSCLVTDSVILSRLVDSTIIVTSYKKTKIDNLKKVKRDIKNVGGNIAGVILNRTHISAKKYEDKYYYGDNNRRKLEKTTKISKVEKRMEQREDKMIEKIKKDTDNFSFVDINNITGKSVAEESLEKLNEYLEREKRNLM